MAIACRCKRRGMNCLARAALTALASLAPLAALAQGAMPGYQPPLDAGLKARLAQADLAAGGKFFERKCSQCHDGEKTGGHAKGPFLWNVFGRRAATIPGFEFSAAMKKTGIVWDEATLDYYLADTERAIPGKAMNFVGIPDPALRAAVVMFLRTLNDNPLLPHTPGQGCSSGGGNGC